MCARARARERARDERSTRARPFPRVCRQSKLLRSLSLRFSRPSHTHARARAPLLRHVSLLSGRSRFHPLSTAWFFLVCAHEGRLPARREEDEERRETRGRKREREREGERQRAREEKKGW